MAEPIKPVAPVTKTRIATFSLRHFKMSKLGDWENTIYAVASVLSSQSSEMAHGPALRCAVAAKAAQLYVGWLRCGWRLVNPIPGPARKHQMRRRGFRPVLAVRGGRSRRRAATDRGLLPAAEWAAVPPGKRHDADAGRCCHDFFDRAEWRHRHA